MKGNIRMRLATTALLGVCGSGALGSGGAASARPLVDPAMYALRGTGPFGASVATAIVTRLAPDRFRLSLTAAQLPPPTALRARFARHAYVAWLVDGAVMHGPLRMAAVGLAATGAAGSYAGLGTVAIGGVTSVIVTAEPNAHAYMPIMPILPVLASVVHPR